MGRGWFFPSASEGKKNHPRQPSVGYIKGGGFKFLFFLHASRS